MTARCFDLATDHYAAAAACMNIGSLAFVVLVSFLRGLVTNHGSHRSR